MHKCRKSISAALAMLFYVAAAATPVLGVHEAVAHLEAHHHHGEAGFGYGIEAAPHAHGEHGHSKLTEARVSMRSPHNESIDAVVHAGAVTSLHVHHAATRMSIRPTPRPPRSRDTLSITTVLRI